MPDKNFELEGFVPEGMTDEEWEDEKEAIMDSMYPEGYDPDVDGDIFDDY